MKWYWKLILGLAVLEILKMVDNSMGIDMNKTFGFWNSLTHDFLYAAFGLFVWLMINYEKD